MYSSHEPVTWVIKGIRVFGSVMKGLKSLRVRNLRSFGCDNEFIPLKKLNILVGKNSCGKSTFLRMFPLLRQSVQADTRSPILWYGSLVDFGDLNTAVNSNAQEVMFDFDMDISVSDEVDYSDEVITTRFFSGFEDLSNSVVHFPVMFTLGVSRNNGVEVASRIRLCIEDVAVEVVYKESTLISLELTVDGTVLSKGFEGREIVKKGKLIPIDFSSQKEGAAPKKGFWFMRRIRSIFRSDLLAYVSALHHQNKKQSNIAEELSKISLTPKHKVAEELIKLFPTDKKFHANLMREEEDISKIVFAYLIGVNLHKILASVDHTLSGFYSGVRYLGPVRASAERFYRYQDLQVAEIDHTGSNLPMVLNSLHWGDRALLNDWIKDSFGFELQLTNTGSHYALSIRESASSEFHNVSDMGFGYSQLLPIIVSIWLENNSKSNDLKKRFNRQGHNKLVLAIEQPELHLHPQLQHMFGRAIAKIAKLQSNSDFCFILETHSKHIIDAIGECIEEDELHNDDVSVTLFEKNSSGYTETRLSSFDESGYLVNWPAGFLSP